MKKMLPFLAVVLFTAAAFTGADPGEGIKPPDFLKVGNRYTFVFASGPEYDRVHGEIKSFGPGTWMRVERMPEPESERRRIEVPAPQRPGASDKTAKEPRRLDIPAQAWFNLSKLAAVVLQEKPESVAPVPDASSFPKVGAPYYLNARSGFYFGKVLETREDGWFRVHEKNPTWSKETNRNVHCWINLAFLTQLTEAKPGDWPE